jgi:hypothetical protein
VVERPRHAPGRTSPDPATDNVGVTVRRIHALRRPVTRSELPLPNLAAAAALLAGAELQIWLTSDLLHASRAGLTVTYALSGGASRQPLVRGR